MPRGRSDLHLHLCAVPRQFQQRPPDLSHGRASANSAEPRKPMPSSSLFCLGSREDWKSQTQSACQERDLRGHSSNPFMDEDIESQRCERTCQGHSLSQRLNAGCLLFSPCPGPSRTSGGLVVACLVPFASAQKRARSSIELVLLVT